MFKNAQKLCLALLCTSCNTFGSFDDPKASTVTIGSDVSSSDLPDTPEDIDFGPPFLGDSWDQLNRPFLTTVKRNATIGDIDIAIYETTQKLDEENFPVGDLRVVVGWTLPEAMASNTVFGDYQILDGDLDARYEPNNSSNQTEPRFLAMQYVGNSNIAFAVSREMSVLFGTLSDAVFSGDNNSVSVGAQRIGIASSGTAARYVVVTDERLFAAGLDGSNPYQHDFIGNPSSVYLRASRGNLVLVGLNDEDVVRVWDAGMTTVQNQVGPSPVGQFEQTPLDHPQITWLKGDEYAFSYISPNQELVMRNYVYDGNDFVPDSLDDFIRSYERKTIATIVSREVDAQLIDRVVFAVAVENDIEFVMAKDNRSLGAWEFESCAKVTHDELITDLALDVIPQESPVAVAAFSTASRTVQIAGVRLVPGRDECR